VSYDTLQTEIPVTPHPPDCQYWCGPHFAGMSMTNKSEQFCSDVADWRAHFLLHQATASRSYNLKAAPDGNTSSEVRRVMG
jgi:hypothetical protein